MLVVVGIIFVVLLLLGMPIAFTIGIATLSAFFIETSMSLEVAAQKAIGITQSFSFLAIPFFILAGNIMNVSGITDRLVSFAKILTGHMAGGLAQVSIVLSALMGGISGSAAADTAMEARFLGPSMLKSGFSRGFTGAVLAFGGLITATIPPSMGLILYGFVGDVSLGKLFLAGIIPGVVLGTAFMLTTHIISKKNGYQPENKEFPKFKDVLIGLKESIWALLFPIILIAGIRLGIFTTSEAGAFAIVYAIIIGFFVHKELTFKKLIGVFNITSKDNGNLLGIVIFASIFSYISAFSGVPREIAGIVSSITTDKYMVLFIILLFLLIVGMFMESTVNTLLFTPIFLPIVVSVGIDPVHFGVLMMTVVTVGSMTPPVGVSMFVVQSILDVPTKDYIKNAIPYLGAVLVTVVILAAFPQIVMFLPDLFY